MIGGEVEIKILDDGGNPRTEISIHQTDNQTFSVTPFSEDNDPNYKFRMEVLAINTSDQFRKIRLQVNWDEPAYNKYRTVIYHRSQGNINWESVSMRTEGNSAIGNLKLPPGKSTIASQPSYSYGENLKFIDNVESLKNCNIECIGETAQKRKIHQIVLNNYATSRKKRSIVIVCRIHPYETAGSYCAEGIVNSVVQKKLPTIGRLDRYRIHLIPMANPDGVYGGLCKRTAQDGIDLSKHVDPNDSTCSILVDFLDSVRPDIYCEIHNWMLPDVDGIYFLNRFQACRLARRLPRDTFKKWKVEFNKKIFAASPLGLKKFCRDKFNSTAFVLEFPWFGRSTSKMKEIGGHTLKAISYL